ncbi:MAG: tetratricopeptide repeat protein [Candidatus Omnitrophota bacterium]
MRKKIPDFLKPLILITSLFLFFALFSTVLTGVESKNTTDLTKTITQGYVINTRYLLGCDYYNQGVKYSNNQQYDKALVSFRKAVELLPKGHPGYVLSKIEIQRLTDPGFLEEKKNRYEILLTEEVTQQLENIEKEARKIVGIAVEKELEPASENQEVAREKRLKKAARQVALELAIENLKKQIEQENNTTELSISQKIQPDEEGLLKEKIRSLVDQEFAIRK